MSHLLSDLRFAMRLLLKQPGFTAVVLMLLGLGVGANSAIFSVVHATLLSPLPFPQSERLVWLSETVHRNGGVETRPLSYPNFQDWKAQSKLFSAMGAFSRTTLTLGGDGEPVRIPGEFVSDGYFEVLGAHAALGRGFLPEENEIPGAHAVAVISHALWQQRFAGARDVVGRSLLLNDHPFSIVGVMPKGFAGWEAQAQVWIPMMMLSVEKNATLLGQRGDRWVSAVGRLASGASLKGAQQELDALSTRLSQIYPAVNAQRGARLTLAHEEVFGELRPALLMLWSAVGLVLLSMCANIANLLLARAVGRRKEMAVRLALGANRSQLIQQLLMESLLLAVLGGVLGLLLSSWFIDLLRVFLPEEFAVRLSLGVSAPVILFNFGCALCIGLFIAVVPALNLSSISLLSTLKEDSSQSAPGQGRLRSILVATNVALAVILLVGAGLMVRSFQRLNSVEAGFIPDHVLTLSLSLPRARYQSGMLADFQQRLQERLRAMPLLSSSSLASDVPLGPSSSASLIGVVPEAGDGVQEHIRMYTHFVGPGFFSTLKIPLVKGRVFASSDVEGEFQVAVVSSSLEKRMWPKLGAIGQRLTVSGGKLVEVVGVVEDVRFRNLTGAPSRDPDVYFPLAQAPRARFALLVRTQAQRTVMVKAIRSVVQELDPGLALDNVKSLEEYVDQELLPTRINVLLLSAFAGMTLVLASLGLYGLVAYMVNQRRKEIAIRMALGARASDVLTLILWQGLLPVVVGLAVGVLCALGLSRFMASLLFELSPTDPIIYIAISALLLMLAVLSCYVPARRGLHVDPAIALRADH